MVTKIAKTGGAIALGLLLGMNARTVAAADSGADRHTSVAAWYEKQADSVQAQIDEQTKLQAVNWSHWQLRKTTMPSSDVAEADQKYKETIASLREKKAQLIELAKMHSLQAADAEMLASNPEVQSTQAK
jgi:hypothetical protein